MKEGDRDSRRRRQDANYREVLPHQVEGSRDRDVLQCPAMDRKGMKNAVNLGQQFLSRIWARLTFTEGQVTMNVGGGEVHLEPKGYSRLDGRVDKTSATAGS